jgi:hypothetical protein
LLNNLLRLPGLVIIYSTILLTILSGCSYNSAHGATIVTQQTTPSWPSAEISPPSPSVLALSSIRIISPNEGETLNTGYVEVVVQVANFDLADRIGQTNSPQQGHLNFFLDVDAPNTPFRLAVTEEGSYGVSVSPSYIWPDVLPGAHTLSVELVNNDGTPVMPPVISKIDIFVH